MQRIVDVPQQAAHVHVCRRVPQSGQCCQERLHVLAAVRQQSVIEVSLPVTAADLRQTVRRKAEHRGAEHGDQRHILPGIVDDLQQGQRDSDLRGLVEIAAFLKGAGHIPLRQRLGEGGGPAPRRAHQDHDVLRAAGPQRAILPGDGIPLIQKLTDTLRREPGLRQQPFHRAVICRRLLMGGDEVEFRLAVLPGRVVLRAKVEGLVLTVFHLPHVRRQDVGEDEIGRVQNLSPRAEVFGQQNFAFLPFHRIFSRCEAAVLVKKNRRVRQPEPVNTLLYVPYGKEVFAFTGHRPENGVLHLVGVLILVHQDLPVAARHLTAQFRRRAVPLHQQAKGQMLLIGEVGAVHPQLFRPVSVGKVCRQLQKGCHGRGHGLKVLHGLRIADRQHGSQLFGGSFGVLPQPLQSHDLRVLGHSLRRGEPGKFQSIQRNAGGFPVLCCRQGCEAAAGPQKFFAVSLIEIPAHGGLSRPPQRLHVVKSLSTDDRQQLGGVGRFVEVPAPIFPDRPIFREPVFGISVTLQLFVGFQHQILQGAVIPARAQRIRQQRAALVQFLVKPLQYPGQHALAQELCVIFVQHPEIRRQGIALSLLCQKMGVLPQQCRAEGVHGLDVRLIHPQKLAAEVSVLRGLRHPFGQFGGDLAPQLGGGSLRVGDDEKIIDMAVVLRHVSEQPLHQHLRLAGPGGGRHQQAAAPVFHRRLLLLRQFQLCHGSPPPSSSSFQNSSGFTGRMYRRRSRSRPSRN